MYSTVSSSDFLNRNAAAFYSGQRNNFQQSIQPDVGSGDPDLCCPESIEKYTKDVINWWGGVFKGDYNDDPSVGQIVTRSLLTMIPFVDQGGRHPGSYCQPL